MVEEAVKAVAAWRIRKKLQLSAGKCVSTFFSFYPCKTSWKRIVRVGGAVQVRVFLSLGGRSGGYWSVWC